MTRITNLQARNGLQDFRSLQQDNVFSLRSWFREQIIQLILSNSRQCMRVSCRIAFNAAMARAIGPLGPRSTPPTATYRQRARSNYMAFSQTTVWPSYHNSSSHTVLKCSDLQPFSSCDKVPTSHVIRPRHETLLQVQSLLQPRNVGHERRKLALPRRRIVQSIGPALSRGQPPRSRHRYIEC